MLPPPAKFQKEDLYTKKYWRRIQNLAKSSGTDDGKKKYFFLTGMSKMAFAILFYYRWMHIKIISLWLWISMFVQIKMLFERSNYFLVHVMVQKQCWIDHKQNCFTCRSRGRFDSLTKRLEKSRYDFFLTGIHSMQGWTATTRHGVTRKRGTKRLKHTAHKISLERIYNS